MIDAARLARDLFGLDATATALPGERDLNFRLDAEGRRYVLKLHRKRADLALEDAVLEHLRDEPGVPHILGTKDTPEHTVRLLSWLDGRPWADAPGDLESLGRTVARIDARLKGFEHPDLHRPHRWDLRNAAGLPRLDQLPHQ